MNRYIIEYRNEFSTVVEAESSEDAVARARKDYSHLAWEPIGDLWPEYFEDVTDEPYERCDGGDCTNCIRDGNC